MAALPNPPNRIRSIQNLLITCHFSGTLTSPLNSALALKLNGGWIFDNSRRPESLDDQEPQHRSNAMMSDSWFGIGGTMTSFTLLVLALAILVLAIKA
jgi:hypothetical protein